MKILFTSDVHITDKPSEAYRWRIFEWLATRAINKKAEAIFILGDLLDQKDHHSNRFINQVVRELEALSKSTGARIVIMKGNHDYSDPVEPALGFLNSDAITYIIDETSLEFGGQKFLFIPNTKHFVVDVPRFKAHDFVLMHQTFDGSESASGFKLEGIATKKFPKGPIYIAGDIHVPQQIGPVIYCGSPHHTCFGETFDPRILFWDGAELKSLPRDTLRKQVIEIDSSDALTAENIMAQAHEGDHVKFKVKLKHSELGDWETIRRSIGKLCEELGLELKGIELEAEKRKRIKGRAPRKAIPKDVLGAFCEAQSIDESMKTIGLNILQRLTKKSV